MREGRNSGFVGGDGHSLPETVDVGQSGGGSSGPLAGAAFVNVHLVPPVPADHYRVSPDVHVVAEAGVGGRDGGRQFDDVGGGGCHAVRVDVGHPRPGQVVGVVVGRVRVIVHVARPGVRVHRLIARSDHHYPVVHRKGLSEAGGASGSWPVGVVQAGPFLIEGERADLAGVVGVVVHPDVGRRRVGVGA